MPAFRSTLRHSIASHSDGRIPVAEANTTAGPFGHRAPSADGMCDDDNWREGKRAGQACPTPSNQCCRRARRARPCAGSQPPRSGAYRGALIDSTLCTVQRCDTVTPRRPAKPDKLGRLLVRAAGFETSVRLWTNVGPSASASRRMRLTTVNPQTPPEHRRLNDAIRAAAGKAPWPTRVATNGISRSDADRRRAGVAVVKA